MLTPTCRGSGSPEKAKFLCWSCELLFAVFECLGRCKNAWADAGILKGCLGRCRDAQESLSLWKN